MSSRLLPFLGLIALLGLVDAASARPRRAAQRSVQAAPVVLSKTAPAAESLRQITYPVADLIVPIPSRAKLDVEPLPRASAGVQTAFGDLATVPPPCSFEECALSPLATAQTLREMVPGQSLERELMDLVTHTVAPKTWNTSGGVGKMQFYPLRLSLVVTQTPAVHEEVQALLAALRRVQDVNAVVEMRAVAMTPAAFERACKQMNIVRGAERDHPEITQERVIGPKGKCWTALLDECQVRELLSLVQSDPSTTVTQAPKITMFSGQKVAIETTQERRFLTSLTLCLSGDSNPWFVPTQAPYTTGLRLGLQSVVAPDRRGARVQMKGYWCELAGPVALHRVDVSFPGKNDECKDKEAPFALHLQKPKFSQIRLDQDLTLSDGGTALISCGVVPVEVDGHDLSACWHGFWTGEKLTTSADRHVFFLATSRIVVKEEVEIKSAPTAVTTPSERQR